MLSYSARAVNALGNYWCTGFVSFANNSGDRQVTALELRCATPAPPTRRFITPPHRAPPPASNSVYSSMSSTRLAVRTTRRQTLTVPAEMTPCGDRKPCHTNFAPQNPTVQYAAAVADNAIGVNKRVVPNGRAAKRGCLGYSAATYRRTTAPLWMPLPALLALSVLPQPLLPSRLQQ